MGRWIRSLLVLALVFMAASPAFAAVPGPSPIVVPITQLQLKAPVPVAFSAIPNRYTNVDPATIFDLNGDLVGDLKVSATAVTGQNGALVQLIDPAELNLDNVQLVPAAGYAATAPVQLSRVYVVSLSGGSYAKFMLLQTSPKVTIWFHFGTVTTSRLVADGEGGHCVLTWDALPDAVLGYNVYRYEFLDNNAYSVVLLNDFTIQDTTFTDNTAANRYYLYVVIAIKANGAFGTSTTVAGVQVQSVQRNIHISLSPAGAKLDGTAFTLESPPVIKNGRMMVPAKLFEKAGVTVTTDATGKITLSRRLENVTYTVVMTVDVPDYTWNGTAYKADVPPYKAGSVYMVPVRVVAPALGFGLSFDSAARRATIQWFE
ncbi:MAG TPA: copper amine oxidase N-terminal domain-containing protein [Symbiobacteriaceae bacterium]|nr:copper amine oxidase N-terminal domain-containing protein [Symbiobacteriaceae bacterium]